MNQALGSLLLPSPNLALAPHPGPLPDFLVLLTSKQNLQ